LSRSEIFLGEALGQSYGQANPRQRSITASLVSKLIIDCCLPISIADNVSFCSFLSDLDPKYTPPCRQTITYSILPQMLTTKKKQVKELVERSHSPL
jgi:hypothetical protein